MRKPWMCNKCGTVNEPRASECGLCHKKRAKTKRRKLYPISGKCRVCERPESVCECLPIFEINDIVLVGESWLNGVKIPDGFPKQA